MGGTLVSVTSTDRFAAALVVITVCYAVTTHRLCTRPDRHDWMRRPPGGGRRAKPLSVRRHSCWMIGSAELPPNKSAKVIPSEVRPLSRRLSVLGSLVAEPEIADRLKACGQVA